MITSRLLPGVRVGDATISIAWAKRAGSGGRSRYQYYIDGPGIEHEGDDLQSGAGGGGLQEGMSSLLAFLGAAAEAYAASMRGRESDNADLFPAAVNEWAYQNDSEIGSLQFELDENRELITD